MNMKIVRKKFIWMCGWRYEKQSSPLDSKTRMTTSARFSQYSVVPWV